MQIRSKSLVLADGPGDQDIVDSIVALLEQWRVLGDAFVYRERIDDGDVTTIVWEDPRGSDSEIRLTFDRFADARYVSAASPSPAARDALFDRMSDSIAAVAVDELKAAADPPYPGDPGAVLRLALGLNGNYDASAHELLRAALAHTDDDVRAAAIEAAGLLQWPVLAEDLDAAMAREQNPGLGSMLAGARASLSSAE